METLAVIAQGAARRAVGRQGDLQLRQGDRQGPVEDHVQDGHVDLHVLLRRAAVRSHRPEQAPGREVLPRHRLASGRHRRVRSGEGSHAHAHGRLRRRSGAEEHARRRRRIRLAHARRRPHVDARRDRQAAALHARQQVRDLQGIRADHQRPVASPHDPARPVRVQARPDQGDPARRGRTGEGDRQALRHRRDVARLDLHRSALDAGHRDEPHRRQVQHRRRRRGSGALSQRTQGHPDQGGHQDVRGGGRPTRSKPTSS